MAEEERTVAPGAGTPDAAGAGGMVGAGAGGAELPADERELLESFERLAPAGSVRWGFDDAMRRLSSPEERGTWVEPWRGLPADLWDRGRGAKAGERVLGDVITTLAQELTEYSQRIVDDLRRSVPPDSAVFDALRFLAARVERLEAASDPLGLRPAELAVPVPDVSAWAGDVPSWVAHPSGLPVVVGELGDRRVLDALAGSGVEVDAVDPRMATVWSLRQDLPGRPGQVRVTADDVVDHLDRLAVASRSGVVLSGGVDREGSTGKVALVAGASRVLAPGGAVVLVVTDQSAWDAALVPPVRDLSPGRPFHPDTWALVLDHLGLVDVEVHLAGSGTAHAVVARRPR